MSLPSVLLRILLSMSLAFGGAVPAMARMAETDAHALATAAGTSTRHVAAATPMHCHGHAATRAAGRAASPAAGHPAGHDDGCCPSGKCDCACMHPAQLATQAIANPPGGMLHARVVSRLRTGHDEPLLPHLIRPPNASAALGA